jgi:hypothetical protein
MSNPTVRLYNVIVFVPKTKVRVQMNATPMTHQEACTFKSKITPYKWRLELLEEVIPS